MKKFLLYFISSILVSIILTVLYSVLDFKLTGWFYNDKQFILITGFLCIANAIRYTQHGAIGSNNVIHVNSTSFEDHHKEMISKDRYFDSRLPVTLAFIFSGIVQLIVGIVVFGA